MHAQVPNYLKSINNKKKKPKNYDTPHFPREIKYSKKKTYLGCFVYVFLRCSSFYKCISFLKI